jgi:hypothetical protein
MRALITVAAITAVMVAPATVWAIDKFTDVPDSNVFHDDISWLADAGVTLGCNPPDNDRFCPDSPVTRGQMAAFMRRLAENQVVDAATLDGNDPSAYTTSVNGVSCDAGSCIDAPDTLTQVEHLELVVSAPANGNLQIASSAMAAMSAPTNEFTSFWVTVDGTSTSFDGCETNFLGIPTGTHVPEGGWQLFFLDGNVDYTPHSLAVTVPVTAGDHTVRLCSYNSAAVTLEQGSLTATWGATGNYSTLGTASFEPSDELIARLESALAD